MLSEKSDSKMAKAGFILQSPAQYAKQEGLKSLKQACELTGQSGQTLNNWHKYKPGLFKVVIAGCVAIESARPQ